MTRLLVFVDLVGSNGTLSDVLARGSPTLLACVTGLRAPIPEMTCTVGLFRAGLPRARTALCGAAYGGGDPKWSMDGSPPGPSRAWRLGALSKSAECVLSRDCAAALGSGGAGGAKLTGCPGSGVSGGAWLGAILGELGIGVRAAWRCCSAVGTRE